MSFYFIDKVNVKLVLEPLVGGDIKTWQLMCERKVTDGIGVKTVQSILMEIDGLRYLTCQNMVGFVLNVLFWKRPVIVKVSSRTTNALSE